jgi:hypothetical protein
VRVPPEGIGTMISLKVGNKFEIFQQMVKNEKHQKFKPDRVEVEDQSQTIVTRFEPVGPRNPVLLKICREFLFHLHTIIKALHS